jgi:hypothetical protein
VTTDPLTNYVTTAPFNTQAKLLELCDQLNRLSAVKLSPADMGRNLTIPLSALVDEDEGQKFIAAFTWVVAQVRQSAATA